MPSYSYISSFYEGDMNKFRSLLIYQSSIYFFNKIEKVKYFNEYSERLEADILSPLKLDDRHCEFINEHLLDEIKLIICFENIMKGKLLENGYVVHKLKADEDFPELNDLKKKQRKQPVLISDFLKYDHFKLIGRTHELEHLHNTTITFNQLLQKKYQDVIQIPKEVLKFIEKSNQTRNTIHLNPSNAMVGGKKHIPIWENIAEYLNSEIIEHFNNSIEEYPNLKPLDLIELY